MFGRKKKKKNEEQNLPVESDQGPAFRHDHIPGTLDLGWYYSDNKDEFQMAKVRQEDRVTHFYVVGATGTGKTKFLEFLIQQDIQEENGFAVIDPHGDLIEDIKGFLAYFSLASGQESLLSDRLVLIEPTNPRFTVTFNPLEKQDNISVPEQVNELLNTFKKIWSDSWGVRMEDLMRNSLIALGEAGLTLCELPAFLTEREFRKPVLKKVSHPIALEYFKRFDTMTDRAHITWIEPVMNKINAFFSDDRIRQMFSSPKSSFNIREIMDKKKILLVNLNKGKLKGSGDLLGSLLMAKIQLAAFSRSNVPQSRRIPFYLYIDEFQNFATESFSVILSEARKYRLSLIMAHQSLAQISNQLKSLILGNTGIQAFFRINRQDAQLLAKEAFEYSGFQVKSVSLSGEKYWSLGEEWEKHTEELQKLPLRSCYIKHKIEGGLIPINTVQVFSTGERLGMNENECEEFMKRLPFGQKYLVKREKMAALAEKRQRLIEEKIEKRTRKEIEEAPAKKVASRKKKSEEIEKKEPAAAEKTKGAKKKTKAPAELSPEEKVFLKYLSEHPGTFITKLYETLELSGYKGNKLKNNLIKRGYIKQEETREGEKGRLAKALFITDKGTAELKKFADPGKGGEAHKQLQAMIKEQAGLLGWKGKIEQRIRGSRESVDVGLKREDVRVAVEVADTSKPSYEIENIRKCLEAGYDYVFSVCADGEQLAEIKTEAKKSFSFKERERIRFCFPSRFKDVIADVTPGIVSEKGIVSGQITEQKELMGTEETAEYLGISRNTLYEWIVQRKIPHIKVGRLNKFKRTDIEKWLEKRIQEEEEFTP